MVRGLGRGDWRGRGGEWGAIETLRLATGAGGTQVTIEKDALFQVDGVPADLQAVIKKGGELVVYPKRGRTIIAFAPVDVK